MPVHRNTPAKPSPFHATWNYIRLNSHAVFFSIILFVLFPFLYTPSTFDPELHLRYFALSVVLSMVWIYFLIRSGEKVFPFLLLVKNKSFLCFGMFFLLSLLSVTWSINTGDSLYEASKIFLLLLCFACFIFSIRQSPDAINIFSIAVASAVIIFTLLCLLSAGPLLIDSVSGHKPITEHIRLVSSFANKNFYAETIFLCLPFALYGSLFFKKAARILCLISLFFIAVTIVILTSVSVWVASTVFFVVMVICLLRFNNKVRLLHISFRKAVVTLLVCVASLFIVFVAISKIPAFQNFYNPLLSKIEATTYYLRHGDKVFINDQANANSLFERILLIRNSMLLFREHPVLGCGLAGWKIYFPKFGITGTGYLNQGRLRFEHPHNDYLLVLCEEGIPGLLLWFGIFMMAFKNIFSLVAKTNERKTLFLLLLLFSAAIGFMTMSFFGYPKERLYSMVLLLLILAIPAAMAMEKTNIPFRYNRLLLTIISFLCITSAYIQLKKLQGEIHMHKSLAFQKTNNMSEMRYEVLKAKTFFYPLDATSTPLNWYLGLSSYYTGDTAAAFNYYTLALAENPYHVQVLNDLGTLYEKTGSPETAIELYKRALMISPANANAILNLTAAYYNTGDMDNALNSLKKYPANDLHFYKKELQAILIAKANIYVRHTGDTALAEYLSAQLNANENYLLDIYSASADSNIHFETLAASIRKKEPF